MIVNVKVMQDRIKDLMFLKHLFLVSLRACFVFGLLGTLCLNGVGEGMHVDSSGASSSPDGLSMLANVATEKSRESEQSHQPVASSSAPAIVNVGKIDFDNFDSDTEQLPPAKWRRTDDRIPSRVSTSQEKQERRRKLPSSSQVEREQREQDALLGASPELKASWETVKAQVSEETRRRSDFRTNLLVSAYYALYEAVQANKNLSAKDYQDQFVEKLNEQYKDELPKVNQDGGPSPEMEYLRFTFNKLLPGMATALPRAGLQKMKLGIFKKGKVGFEIKLIDEHVEARYLHYFAAKAERVQYEQDALVGASEKLQKSWGKIRQSPSEEIHSHSFFKPGLLVKAYCALFEAVQANNNLSAEDYQVLLVETLNTQYKDELSRVSKSGSFIVQMEYLRFTFNQLLPAIAEQLPRACLKGMKLSLLKRGRGGFEIKLIDEHVDVANRVNHAAQAERVQYEQDVLKDASPQVKESWKVVKASVSEEIQGNQYFRSNLLVLAYLDLYKAVQEDNSMSAENYQKLLMEKLNTQYKEELLESTNNGQLSGDMRLVQCTFNLLLPGMAGQLPQAGLGEIELSVLRNKGGDGFKYTLRPPGAQKKGRPPKNRK